MDPYQQVKEKLESNNLTEQEKEEGLEYLWLDKKEALEKMRIWLLQRILTPLKAFPIPLLPAFMTRRMWRKEYMVQEKRTIFPD